ncbi:hypothetical protein [Altericista sp. CCNU0014]|uniref:hypothetical protein n=1 Tax=Altericista sp. CCNU0014 TaxID=3082949 RepID=UPI00384EE4B3
MEYSWTAMQDLEPALRPVYSAPEINEAIILHDGALVVEKNAQTFEGQGKIAFNWFPTPKVSFEFKINAVGYLQHGDNVCLRFVPNSVEVSSPVEVSVSLSRTNQGNDFYGAGSCQNINIGSDNDLQYVLFHVANFHDLLGRPCARIKTENGFRCIERNIVEAEGWRITLDQLETTTEHIKQISSQGGFAITHVAKLERVDSHTFRGKDAIEFLDICSHCLSFARGFRIPLMLCIGYDKDDNRVWEFWSSRLGLSWKSVSSWFPKSENRSLAKLFPGFFQWYRLWQEKTDPANANIVLNTYLEANSVSTLEVKLMLVQIALELSAWIHLVIVKELFEKNQFNFPASIKIRELLNSLEIPVEIPPFSLVRKSLSGTAALLELGSQNSNFDLEQDEHHPIPLTELDIREISRGDRTCTFMSKPQFQDLHRSASDHQWDDGPHALTAVRNDVAHAIKKYPNLDPEAEKQLCRLGLWYLELSMLALMNYDGYYINRCILPNREGEIVPWKTTA